MSCISEYVLYYGMYCMHKNLHFLCGLMQKRCNTIALAMELHFFYIKPLMSSKHHDSQINALNCSIIIPSMHYI